MTRDGATPVPEYLKNVSYAQAHEKIAQIEECHNLKGTPEKIEKKTLEYDGEEAMVYA